MYSVLYSSFYGLLDILSDTQLNPGQQEIGEKFKIECLASDRDLVATAKVSCELLLKVWTSTELAFFDVLMKFKTYADYRLDIGLQQVRSFWYALVSFFYNSFIIQSISQLLS